MIYKTEYYVEILMILNNWCILMEYRKNKFNLNFVLFSTNHQLCNFKPKNIRTDHKKEEKKIAKHYK